MVRASTIFAGIAVLAVGVVGLVLGIYAFVNRGGGKLWFFWVAPLLAIGFFAITIQLVAAYWLKVGRLEAKGRPRK
jgi:hypothetical protein